MQETKDLLLNLEEQFKKNIYDEKNINKFFTLFDDYTVLNNSWDVLEGWCNIQINNSWCNLYKGIVYMRLCNRYSDESLEISAKAGNMFGEYYWGICSLMVDHDTYYYHEDKTIVTKMQVDATNFIKSSAEKGLVQAQIELVKRYISGLGIEKKLLKAIQWIKRIMNNKRIYDIENITNDNDVCNILDISQILLKENEELKQKILELELRPPEVGGSLYQEAKNNFEHISQKN
jgi:hypothetical protein